MTGYKIDIKPESGFYGEEPDEPETVKPEEVEENTNTIEE